MSAAGLKNPNILLNYTPAHTLGRSGNIRLGKDGELFIEGFDFRDLNEPSEIYVPKPWVALSSLVFAILKVKGLDPYSPPKGLASICFFNCRFDGLEVDTAAFQGEGVRLGQFAWGELITFKNCEFEILGIDEDVQFPLINVVSCSLDILATSCEEEGFPETEQTYQINRVMVFENTVIKQIKFDDVHFSQDILFCNCELGNFKTEALEGISFWRAKFLRGVYFEDTNFLQAPAFFHADLSPDESFSGARFLDVSSREAVASYRYLRQMMQKIEADHNVMMFHALELEARYNVELPKGCNIFSSPRGVETIASWSLQKLNGYGQHMWLPFIWLLYIACWFLVLYAALGGVGYYPAGDTTVGWVQAAGEYYPNITFALRNFFGPFGLILSADEIQPNNMLVKSLGVVHFLVSSLIWFIWILQIRSRFKL